MSRWSSLCLRILLSVGLYFSAPRPMFWDTVRMLDDPTDDEVVEQIRSVPAHFSQTYTEFYCNASTGSNVNGGSDAGSPSMSDTAGTGSWNSGTNVYVSASTTGTVTVGQFMSICPVRKPR